jgi:hypothetical protein
MKRVMLALLVVAFVNSPAARAEYIGTISSQAGYTLEVVASASVNVSITILSVVRGRIEVDDVFTSNGNVPPFHIAISRSAERGILLIDTQNGLATIRITGNGGLHEVTANLEARIVFDITP